MSTFSSAARFIAPLQVAARLAALAADLDSGALPSASYRAALLELASDCRPGSPLAALALLAHAREEDARLTPGQQALDAAWDEEAHQMKLIGWADDHKLYLPQLALISHSPNGGKREKRQDQGGRWYSPEAVRLRAMGVRRGYPDLSMNAPSLHWHGLFIELKNLTGETTPEQKAWLLALRLQGNIADVARGWRDARALILEYLAGCPVRRWTPRDARARPLPPMR